MLCRKNRVHSDFNLKGGNNKQGWFTKLMEKNKGYKTYLQSLIAPRRNENSVGCNFVSFYVCGVKKVIQVKQKLACFEIPWQNHWLCSH